MKQLKTEHATSVPSLLSRAAFVVFLFWLLTAVVLRVYGLAQQWLIDDEWHGIHRILAGEPWRDMFFAVGVSDFSVPQTLYYRVLARFTEVDEVLMRLPVVIAGLGLVAGGALWMWRRAGLLEASLLTGFLAFSPMLVYQSRNARPYAITILLTWVALWALARWHKEGQTRWAVLYSLAAVLACWFHAAIVPFVVLPLVWLWGVQLYRCWHDRRWRPLFSITALGAVTAVGIGFFTVLPTILHRDMMATRAGMDIPQGETYAGFAHLLFGHEQLLLVGVLWLFALWGMYRAWQLDDGLLKLIVIGFAATVLSIYLLRPAWVHNPLTFSRYVLPVWPLLLGCTALGLADAIRRLWQHRVALRPVALILLLTPMLTISGKHIRDLLQTPPSLFLHSWYWYDFRIGKNPVRVMFKDFPRSPFWDQLAKLPAGSVRVAVAGHQLESYTMPDVLWLREHSQILINGQRQGLCGQPPFYGEIGGMRARDGVGYRLRNAVDLADQAAVDRMGIDFVAFNRVQAGQEDKLDLAGCIESFRKLYGEPAYSDEHVVAFDLRAK